jgi:hypothetical protein
VLRSASHLLILVLAHSPRLTDRIVVEGIVHCTSLTSLDVRHASRVH